MPRPAPVTIATLPSKPSVVVSALVISDDMQVRASHFQRRGHVAPSRRSTVGAGSIRRSARRSRLGRRRRSRRAAARRPLRARVPAPTGSSRSGSPARCCKLAADERRRADGRDRRRGRRAPCRSSSVPARRACGSRSSSPATRRRAGASCVVVPAPLSGALGDGALVDYFVRIAAAVVAARHDPGRARLPRRRARAGLVQRDRRGGRERPAREARGGAGRDERLDRRARGRLRDLGRRRRRLPARLRALAAPPGSSRASTSSTSSCASTRRRPRGETRARRRTVPRDPADARLRDAALDRPLQRLRQARSSSSAACSSTTGCDRPRGRSAALSRELLERHLAGTPAHAGRCRVSADGRPVARRAARAAAAERSSSPRCSPQRSSPAASASARRSRPSEEIVTAFRRQPDRRPRDRAGARDARDRERPARQADGGLPAEEWDILSSIVQEALRREGKAEPLLRDLYEFRLLIEPQAAALDGRARQRTRTSRELTRLADEMERLAERGCRRPST